MEYPGVGESLNKWASELVNEHEAPLGNITLQSITVYKTSLQTSNLCAGLLAGYYDACMGLVPTQERFNAFNFTISYAESKEVSLYYLKGAEGDLNDLTGKKIGEEGLQHHYWRHCLA